MITVSYTSTVARCGAPRSSATPERGRKASSRRRGEARAVPVAGQRPSPAGGGAGSSGVSQSKETGSGQEAAELEAGGIPALAEYEGLRPPRLGGDALEPLRPTDAVTRQPIDRLRHVALDLRRCRDERVVVVRVRARRTRERSASHGTRRGRTVPSVIGTSPKQSPGPPLPDDPLDAVVALRTASISPSSTANSARSSTLVRPRTPPGARLTSAAAFARRSWCSGSSAAKAVTVRTSSAVITRQRSPGRPDREQSVETVSRAAAAIPSTIGASSSSVTTSGGEIWSATPRRTREITPWRRAATTAAMPAVGFAASRSASSSIAPASPALRTSATPGRSRQRREQVAEHGLELRRALDEALALDDVDVRRAPRRTRRGAPRTCRRGGTAPRPRPRTAPAHARGDDRAERHVAGADALRAGHQVGREPVALAAEPATEASEAGDHLVGDEQDVALAADRLDRRPVAVGWRDPPPAPIIGSPMNAAARSPSSSSARARSQGRRVRPRPRRRRASRSRRGPRGSPTATCRTRWCRGTRSGARRRPCAPAARQLPVAADDLRGRVDRLAATAAEEDRRVVDRREVREPRGELQRRRGSRGRRRRGARERAQLRGDGVRDLGAAVADVREPEPGGGVEVLVAVLVPDAAALTASEHELVPVDLAHRGERVPETGRRSRGSRHAPRLFMARPWRRARVASGECALEVGLAEWPTVRREHVLHRKVEQRPQ